MNVYDFRFYPTLLNSFQNYLDAEKNYNKFYGDSPTAPTLEEYEEKCRRELIDRINRVPFSSEATDRGTAFNNAVDLFIAYDIAKNDKYAGYVITDTEVNVTFNDRVFTFPRRLVEEFANYYGKNTAMQVYLSAPLLTKYGIVQLYGYADEITATTCHDIKTTAHYNTGKYRNTWQHYLYLYCLNEIGFNVPVFEYNITDFRATYTETYNYNREEYRGRLVEVCEHFIEFLQRYKSEITDVKIFGYENK